MLGQRDTGKEKCGDNKAQTVLYIATRRRLAWCNVTFLMNWNDAAEDLLNSILAETPRPARESTGENLRALSEALAEEDGKNRVGVETVIAAWVRSTPETLRPDLPRMMEKFGLDADEYRHLLE